MAYVSRDPFARTELHREIVQRSKSCDWCGGWRHHDGRELVGSLFVYRTESDGGRKSEHRGAFCSKSCHDSYHA